MKRLDIITNIPKEILDRYGNIHLDIDIMFVNKRGYFTEISQHIGLIHCCAITLHVNKRVVDAMTHIIKQYKKRGFTVCSVHGDNKFDYLDEWMMDKKITFMTCNTDINVPTIERTNVFF